MNKRCDLWRAEEEQWGSGMEGVGCSETRDGDNEKQMCMFGPCGSGEDVR